MAPLHVSVTALLNDQSTEDHIEEMRDGHAEGDPQNCTFESRHRSSHGRMACGHPLPPAGKEPVAVNVENHDTTLICV